MAYFGTKLLLTLALFYPLFFVFGSLDFAYQMLAKSGCVCAALVASWALAELYIKRTKSKLIFELPGETERRPVFITGKFQSVKKMKSGFCLCKANNRIRFNYVIKSKHTNKKLIKTNKNTKAATRASVISWR